MPRRRPPRVLVAASAVLLAGVVGLRVRSLFVRDEIEVRTATSVLRVGSARGLLSYERWRDAVPAAEPGWEYGHYLSMMLDDAEPGPWWLLGVNVWVWDWEIRKGSAIRVSLVFVPHATIAVPLALPVAAWAWRHDRQRRRARAGRCPSCGYDLTANASGRCPECGAGIPAAVTEATA